VLWNWLHCPHSEEDLLHACVELPISSFCPWLHVQLLHATEINIWVETLSDLIFIYVNASYIFTRTQKITLMLWVMCRQFPLYVCMILNMMMFLLLGEQKTNRWWHNSLIPKAHTNILRLYACQCKFLYTLSPLYRLDGKNQGMNNGYAQDWTKYLTCEKIS